MPIYSKDLCIDFRIRHKIKKYENILNILKYKVTTSYMKRHDRLGQSISQK